MDLSDIQNIINVVIAGLLIVIVGYGAWKIFQLYKSGGDNKAMSDEAIKVGVAAGLITVLGALVKIIVGIFRSVVGD